MKEQVFFEKDKNKYPDASVLTRDKEQKVLISHDGVLMTCNQAFFYEEKNFIEAFGEVLLKQRGHSKSKSKLSRI